MHELRGTHIALPLPAARHRRLYRDPRDAEYTNGTLMVGGKHVTPISTRVLIDEGITREGRDVPVILAVNKGSIQIAKLFFCKLLYKEISPDVLSEERQAPLLTAAELAASDGALWSDL